jgi:cyclopropane-fatty-acyl-phospholipid synthase
MGEHYAQTLRLWEERFMARADEVGAMGFDAVFQRMWLFYLCYSRAGFETGYLDVQQIVLDHASTKSASAKTASAKSASSKSASAKGAAA